MNRHPDERRFENNSRFRCRPMSNESQNNEKRPVAVERRWR
jgi:hypothetical protein